MGAPSPFMLWGTLVAPDPAGADVTSLKQVETTMEGTNDIFLPTGPSADDVQQMGIGDCWDLATIISIVAGNPDKIRQMVTPTGDGGANVTLWALDKDPNVGIPGEDLRRQRPGAHAQDLLAVG